MHMYFWWSSVVTDFLFYGYNIRTVGGLASTCLGLMALAIIFEWLKLLQAQQRQKELFLRAKQIRTICPPSESATLLFDRRHNRQPLKITLCDRVLLTVWDIFVWFNLQILGYLLMLAAMAYNGWMVISLILGSGIGYFFFGPTFMKINLQNCQVIRETFCSMQCADSEQDGESTPAIRASTSAISVSDTTEEACCVQVHAEDTA